MNKQPTPFTLNKFYAPDPMEHRWSPRKPCDLLVWIWTRNSSPVECLVTDTNHGGLGIDTGLMPLNPGAIVDVELDAPTSIQSWNTFCAMVIHSGRGKAGLWLGDDPEQNLRFQELIADYSVPKRRK